MSVTAASIQLPADEVIVRVHRAKHEKLPDDVWFLTLSTTGGYVTLGGTMFGLHALADRIGLAVDEA